MNEIEKMGELLGIIAQLVEYVEANEALYANKDVSKVALRFQAARKSLGLEDK